MRNRGFTLVEIMIATVVSTLMAMFMLRLMTDFSVQVSHTGEVMATARDASIILRIIKESIREAHEVTPGTDSFVTTVNETDGSLREMRFERIDDSMVISDSAKGTSVNYAKGNIYRLEVKPVDKYGNIFRVILRMKNPQSNAEPNDDNTAEFGCIVTQRVDNSIPDKSWVPNEADACPDEAGNNSCSSASSPSI
jgi:prepilin-type N-terminal cleavage/methylation domain-containing protein